MRLRIWIIYIYIYIYGKVYKSYGKLCIYMCVKIQNVWTCYIKVSNRLTDSPCCLVADQNDPSAKMQEMMTAMGQSGGEKIKPIMEINPKHGLIKKIHKLQKGKVFNDAVHLLYDQALMLEGVKIDDPASFVKRLNDFMSKSL